MPNNSPLQPFLCPRSVALIGISRKTGRGAFNILDNLIELGYGGEIYPVNPKANTIRGLPVYHRVEDLPGEIELAVLMLRRDLIPPTMEACAKKGIPSYIIISEGFAESDEKGRALQARIDELRAAFGLRVIGPNTLGTVNNFGRFSSTYISTPRDRVPAAFITQSGGLLQGFSDFRAGKALDLGNMSDIDYADALDYFSQDPETRVIVLHIEGIQKGSRFYHAAKRASVIKPVLAIKAARSKGAMEAASSHTGVLAGMDDVYKAIFRQSNILRVDDVDTLGDVVNLLLYQPPCRGRRVGIITPTGASGIMLIDELEETGFELASLSGRTERILGPYLAPWSEPRNPVDIMYSAISFGFKNVYQIALKALLEDPQVDAIICVCGYPTIKTIQQVAIKYEKPVLTWIIGQWDERLLSRIRETGYRNIFSSPQRLAKAMDHHCRLSHVGS